MINATAAKVDIREAFAIAGLDNAEANSLSSNLYYAQLTKLTPSGTRSYCGTVSVNYHEDHADYSVFLYDRNYYPVLSSIIPEADATTESIAADIKAKLSGHAI